MNSRHLDACGREVRTCAAEQQMRQTRQDDAWRTKAHAAMAAEAPLRPGEDGVRFGRLLVVHDEHLHVRAQRVVRRELLEDRDLRVGRRRA